MVNKELVKTFKGVDMQVQSLSMEGFTCQRSKQGTRVELNLIGHGLTFSEAFAKYLWDNYSISSERPVSITVSEL